MLRINILGTGFLDIADAAGVSFKRENHFFRFADITLGRSTEFTVPATEGNRKKLNFGDDPAQYGEMMRTYHAAQLVYDGGLINGSLSVTGYQGDAFKCIFLSGNYEWVNALQGMKLSELPIGNDGILWATSTQVVTADMADASQVQIVDYDNGGVPATVQWQKVPSINLHTLTEKVLDAAGIPYRQLEINIPTDYWLVAGSMKGATTETISFSATTPTDAAVQQQTAFFSTWDDSLHYVRDTFFGINVGAVDTPCRFYEALVDVELTFPTDFPTNTIAPLWSRNWKYKQFLGDYGHNIVYNNHRQFIGYGLSGEPLAGRTVTIKKGTRFFFFSASNYGFIPTGYQRTAAPYSFKCEAKRSGDISLGERWLLANNLPDMTVFEFLKSVCLATGRELYVNEERLAILQGYYGRATLYGSQVDFFKPLERVISIDEVTRNVDAWGSRASVVDFDSDDYVENGIEVLYDIPNLTLEGETRHTCKFSEGEQGTAGVLIADVDTTSNPAKFKGKKWTVARAAGKTLQRILPPEPVGYDDIALQSTCIRVKVMAGEADFFRLQPATTYIWRGMAYVWTDASWTDGVLSLTLQKVSQQWSGNQNKS